MEKSVIYALWLVLTCGAASSLSLKALRTFGNFEDIYAANEEDFDGDVFGENEIKKLCRKDLSEAVELEKLCRKKNIDVYTVFSENYPPLLRESPEPPILLFGKGKMPDFKNLPSLTVVGSRKCPPDYGKIASKICYELALADFITVTGVAAGADTYAKKGALLAEGKTVTVLPCGIETVYSSTDEKARMLSLENGIILSEYLPYTVARRHHFGKRNRILAAISDATLVVCAEEKSGTLITVEHAKRSGRPVFAIPGSPASAASKVPNDLIRSGAVLCRNSEDVIDEYRHIFKGTLPERRKKPHTHKIKTPPQTNLFNPVLEGLQKDIYALLKTEAMTSDTICEKLGVPFSETISELQMMQIDGIIGELPGGLWHVTC